MQTAEPEKTHRRTPILRRITVGLILIAVAALVIHLIAGLIMAIFYGALIAAAVILGVWVLLKIVW